MKMHILPFLLIASLVAGCVSTYRLPEGKPVAKVRVTTNTDDNTSLFIVDRKGCGSALVHMGPQLASHEASPVTHHVAGQSKQPPARTRERLIEAGGRLDFVVMSSAGGSGVYDPGYRCSIGVGLLPEGNAHYEIEYLRDVSARRCAVNVLRLDVAGGEVTRVSEPTAIHFQPPPVSACDRAN